MDWEITWKGPPGAQGAGSAIMSVNTLTSECHALDVGAHAGPAGRSLSGAQRTCSPATYTSSHRADACGGYYVMHVIAHRPSVPALEETRKLPWNREQHLHSNFQPCPTCRHRAGARTCSQTHMPCTFDGHSRASLISSTPNTSHFGGLRQSQRPRQV